MKAFEWCGTHADVLFLLPRAASSSELPLGVGAEAWRTTRKHVRNDAGTGKFETVMCRFMGQPVGDIGTRQSQGSFPLPGYRGVDAGPVCYP